MPKFVMGPHETRVCQELAGPDLYYALKRLLTECGEGGLWGRAVDKLSRDTIEMAERALRKAEGN